jgi:hypothetical protein
MRGEFVALLQMLWDKEAEQLVLLVQEPPRGGERTGKEWTLVAPVLRATAGREEFYKERASVEDVRAPKVEEVHPTHEPSMDTRWCDSCNRMIANRNGPTATGVDPCERARPDYQTC